MPNLGANPKSLRLWMSVVGIAFKSFRGGKLLHAITSFLDKILSYAKGAPTPILKVLNERRGNRFQTFSMWKNV